MFGFKACFDYVVSNICFFGRHSQAARLSLISISLFPEGQNQNTAVPVTNVWPALITIADGSTIVWVAEITGESTSKINK